MRIFTEKKNISPVTECCLLFFTSEIFRVYVQLYNILHIGYYKMRISLICFLLLFLLFLLIENITVNVVVMLNGHNE